jgi:exopolysaccharide biosynthesis polyprenyl glycosylphosphotransferase
VDSEIHRLSNLYKAFIKLFVLVISCFLSNLLPLGQTADLLKSWTIFSLALPAYSIAYYISGVFKLKQEKQITLWLKNIFKTHTLSILLIWGLVYFIQPMSGGLFVTFVTMRHVLYTFSINAALTLISECLFYKVAEYMMYRQMISAKALIISHAGMSGETVSKLKQNRSLSYNYIGVIADDLEMASEVYGLNVLGGTNSLASILKKNVVDEVIIVIPQFSEMDIEPYLRLSETAGITARVLFDVPTHALQTKVTSQDGYFSVSYYNTKFTVGQLFAKRVMDIIGALVGLCITGVLMIFIVPTIKLDSKGPVFFSQIRVGQNGRRFQCYKFRSMCQDAELLKPSLMRQNEMDGMMFKIKEDPRVTKVGKFLRASSLDELPQFWNVLRGDMSLVGTRPPTIDEVKKYELNQFRRISIKPGLSGNWQISGRNDIVDFNDVINLDLQYIRGWSLWLDIKIIFKTMLVVLNRSGK